MATRPHMWVGRAEQMGAAGLIVGAKRKIPGLWRLFSTCFLLLNSLFSSCSFGLYGELPLCFFFLRVASRRLRSCWAPLDSAKYVRYEGPAALSSPSSIAKKLRPLSTSSYYVRQIPGRERKLTFLSMTTIDIPKRDRHVPIRTCVSAYAHPENFYFFFPCNNIYIYMGTSRSTKTDNGIEVI